MPPFLKVNKKGPFIIINIFRPLYMVAIHLPHKKVHVINCLLEKDLSEHGM